MEILCLVLSELELVRAEVTSLKSNRDRLDIRIVELEEELKKTKDDIEKQKTKAAEEGEVLSIQSHSLCLDDISPDDSNC